MYLLTYLLTALVTASASVSRKTCWLRSLLFTTSSAISSLIS